MKLMLVLLVAIAVIFDLRERRIPNWLVLSGFCTGLGGVLFHDGWAALGNSLAASLLGMLAFFPFFLLRMVGAGDVKLFGMVGSFVGTAGLLPIWFYTVLAGGVLGIASVLLAGTFPRFIQNLRLLLISVTYRSGVSGVSLSDMAEQSSTRIPYAVAIAAGIAVWLGRQS